jgi:hypothetical protein
MGRVTLRRRDIEPARPQRFAIRSRSACLISAASGAAHLSCALIITSSTGRSKGRCFMSALSYIQDKDFVGVALCGSAKIRRCLGHRSGPPCPGQWRAHPRPCPKYWTTSTTSLNDIDIDIGGLGLDTQYACMPHVRPQPGATGSRSHGRYRPLFLLADQKPAHDAVRTWVRGFWKAVELAPETWSALVEDERSKTIIAPFVGFFEIGKIAARNP